MPSALSRKDDSEGNVLPLAWVIREDYSGKIRISGRPGKEGKITIGLEKLKGVFWVQRTVKGEKSPKVEGGLHLLKSHVRNQPVRG